MKIKIEKYLGVEPGQGFKDGDIIYCIKPYDGRYSSIEENFLKVGKPYYINGLYKAGWGNDFFISQKEFLKIERKNKLKNILYENIK